MASTDTTKPKSKSAKRSGKSSGQERLKTVVRRLPANLPEEIFWQSVHNWVTDDTVIWKEFYPGKLRKNVNKQNILSRAYIAFKSEELLATFSREYDGHIFRDKAGNESRAVVEFAPYQKIPPLEKKKMDSRNGTIEKEEDFISFMQLLDAPATKPHDNESLLETLIASTQPQAQPKSTPLLEALKAEKSAQKDKEAILRNHPHYKDVQIAAKKEESKKKGPPAPPPPKTTEAVPPTSKKAAKKAAAAQKANAQQQQKSSALQTQDSKASSSSPATATATDPAPPHPPTAPKAMRAGRQHPRGQPPRPEQQPSKRVVSASSITEVSTPVSSATPATASTDSAASPVVPPGGRRPRPILGLAASRQFEAALSGAGVAKPKRDRVGDREKEKDLETAGEGSQGKGKEPPIKDVKSPTDASSSQPTNPNQRKPAPARTPAGVLPITGILQRDPQQPPRILTRTPEPEGSAVVTPITPSVDIPRGRGFGGRGRGGRGRGRGAPRGN